MRPPRIASILDGARPDAPEPVLETSGAPLWTWYSEGDTLFADMLAAIAAARLSVRLETYIFEAAGIGIRMRDSLAAAAIRGVRVRVLVDGFGSSALPADFWEPLREVGGEARVFNPLRLDRMGIPAPNAARQTVHCRRRGVRRFLEPGPAQPAPELRDHAAAERAGRGDGGARGV
jgi:phosphatidylserine/phosphatidylglycerophosphate/cardiolipin synthase-like enzyme